MVGASLVLAGCSSDAVSRGFLPEDSVGATNQTDRITSLWNGSWIAALFVGVVTWGLILWCVAVYRKRKGDNTLPVQLRYHVPLEVMYVILPVIMIGVLFFQTFKDTEALTDVSATPDLTVHLIGKQWSWDFNYVDDDVWDSGVQTDLESPQVEEEIPTLYLPVNERVEFVLDTRDVNHSFWVPAFLFKMDLIAGRTNHFQVVPTKEGVFAGKCAEFCGENHSEMLFNVAVVSQDAYRAHIAELRDKGQTGQIGMDYSRTYTADEPGTEDANRTGSN